MAEKKKYPVRTSPRGTLIFPHFNVPDTKFAKEGEKGDYRGTLRVTTEDFAKLQPLIDQMAETAIDVATDKNGAVLEGSNRRKSVEKGVSKPYKQARDKNDNLIEGFIDVSFKASWGGVDRKTGETYHNKPTQFDCSTPPKVVDLILRTGTIAKISFTMFPWATALLGYGVSLRPKAVQIIRLAAKGEADPSYFGFDGEEGGFENDDGSEDFSTKPETAAEKPAETDDEEIPF